MLKRGEPAKVELEGLTKALFKKLQQERDDLKAERDALMADLKAVCTHPSLEPCELCKHCGTMPDDCMEMDFGELQEACRHCDKPCICAQCQNGEKWEWRGVQKEEK